MLNRIIYGVSSKSIDIIYSIVIGIMIINYLGPEEQGRIAFINNLSLFFSFFITLGLNSIYTIICGSNNINIIKNRYGYYSGLRALGFLAFMIVMLVIIYTTKPDVVLIALPILVSKFFVSLNLYQSIVDGRGKFKEYTISQFISLVITSMIVIFCIKNNYGVIAIASTFLIKEALSFFVFYFLFDDGKYFKISFNSNKYKTIFRRSSKLMLSSIVVGLFTQIDILMIGWFISDSSAGVYSASTRLTTPLNFISVIFVAIFISSLIEKYKNRKTEYYHLISLIVSSLFSIYIVIVLFVYYFGGDFYFKIFSHQYSESLSLYYIHILGLFFIFLGGITGNHLVIIKDYDSELKKTIYAACLNIILNFIGIYYKNLEIIAISSVVSYALANFLFFITYKDRLFFKSLIKGFNPFLATSYFIEVIFKKKTFK
ncbi:oligosaccharide flippase family protein [Photobacterium phosphoreum]|uniref:oligosaccharide flippase family protein n=1 Tax=Photobacterium phosphoreum TaxID=659 RepID=UPI0039AF9D9E